ncbi:MAG: SurA N-terminal domain-containing protein, partial [Fimbriimonadales bacterium]
MKKVVIALTGVASAAIIAGCGGGGPTGEVVASFNGEEITRDEYLKTLETLDTILVVLPDGRQAQVRPAQSLSTQALSKIVEREVVLESAKKNNVLPSQADVDREKTLRSDINPQFQDQLRSLGFSGDDIESALRIDLALYKLTVMGQKEKTIEDAEKYVKDNPAQFRQPESVTFSWIVVSDPAVRAEVDKMLVNASFGAAAARYSVVPTAKTDNGAFNSGGSTQARPVPLTERVGEPLYSLLKKTKEGATTEWFKYQNAWAKIQVQAKSPAVDLKPKPSQLEVIRRDLSRTD